MEKYEHLGEGGLQQLASHVKSTYKHTAESARRAQAAAEASQSASEQAAESARVTDSLRQRIDEAERETREVIGEAQAKMSQFGDWEEIRNSNEEARKSEELKRTRQEELREDTEAARNTAEGKRQTDEAIRNAHEATREAKEQERENGELQRQTTYMQKEAERQQAFEENEETRQSNETKRIGMFKHYAEESLFAQDYSGQIDDLPESMERLTNVETKVDELEGKTRALEVAPFSNLGIGVFSAENQIIVKDRITSIHYGEDGLSMNTVQYGDGEYYYVIHTVVDGKTYKLSLDSNNISYTIRVREFINGEYTKSFSPNEDGDIVFSTQEGYEYRIYLALHAGDYNFSNLNVRDTSERVETTITGNVTIPNLQGYVKEISGKQLSTNDYTDQDKEKLEAIPSDIVVKHNPTNYAVGLLNADNLLLTKDRITSIEYDADGLGLTMLNYSDSQMSFFCPIQTGREYRIRFKSSAKLTSPRIRTASEKFGSALSSATPTETIIEDGYLYESIITPANPWLSIGWATPKDIEIRISDVKIILNGEESYNMLNPDILISQLNGLSIVEVRQDVYDSMVVHDSKTLYVIH